MKKIRHVVFDHDGTLVDATKSGELYSGIDEMLAQLAQERIKLYIWTARTRHSTVEFLKSLGIINRFDQLLCSTDPDPKPCAQGLRDMLEGVEPGSTVVVGDSSADIVGAKSYGAYAIGALWASSPGNEYDRHCRSLESCGANFLANTVEECKTKILKLSEH